MAGARRRAALRVRVRRHGQPELVVRGGGGLFYDRPDGNTVFSIPGNPPIATSQDLRNGQLPTLGQGLSPQPVPALITFQYNAKVPASVAVAGRRPDGAAVGDGRSTCRTSATTAINRLGAFQGGSTRRT